MVEQPELVTIHLSMTLQGFAFFFKSRQKQADFFNNIKMFSTLKKYFSTYHLVILE